MRKGSRSVDMREQLLQMAIWADTAEWHDAGVAKMKNQMPMQLDDRISSAKSR